MGNTAEKTYVIAFLGRFGQYEHGFWDGHKFIREEGTKTYSLDEAKKIVEEMSKTWDEVTYIRYES